MTNCPATDVLEHVHECYECRAQLAAMRATSEAFVKEAVPEHIIARIETAIGQAAREEAVHERANARATRGAEVVLAGATGMMIALTAGAPPSLSVLSAAFVLFAFVPLVGERVSLSF